MRPPASSPVEGLASLQADLTTLVVEQKCGGRATSKVDRRQCGRKRLPVLALRVILRRSSNSVAFGAKPTFSEPRLPNRIYEYAP
jgi:hypothetical protein